MTRFETIQARARGAWRKPVALALLLLAGTAAIGVPTQAQNIFYGLVLIVAVAATMSRSRSGIVK